VGNCRHDLATTAGGKFCKKSRCDLAGYISESIAVEEKEWSAAMTLPQEIYGLLEREDLLLF